MRASSLSDPRVLGLLERYFVPVLFSIDDYHREKKGKANDDEWERIRGRARSHGYPKGSVCVYLVDPSGDVIESMLVDQASQPGKLVPMLMRAIDREKAEPRNDAPRRAPAAGANSVRRAGASEHRLHILTRNLGSNWSLGVGEDRVELTADDWRAFLPEAEVQSGQCWPVPRKVIDKIYPYFFPPIKNYNAENSVILDALLTARVTDRSGKQIRLSLRGTLEMDHPLREAEKPALPGAQTNGRIRATVVGSAVFDRGTNRLQSMQLLADNADYIWHWQGKPVNSNFVAAAELER